MVRKLAFDVQEEDGEADSIEVALSTGQKFLVYQPTTGQSALMMSAFSDDSAMTDAAKAILDFYKDITEPEGYEIIRDFLRNPRIPDSLEKLIDLTEKVIEAFTGNPTKQPTDYLPSRQSGGQSSTGSRQRPASTRSRSPRTASATGSTRSSSRD